MQTTSLYYPNIKLGDTEEQQLFTLDAWYDILKDYDYNEINHNLTEYVKTGASFPPNVGQLLPKQKENKSKYVPDAADTQKYLLDMQHREALALNDPELERVRLEAQMEIRKTLGIDKG